MMRVPVFLLVAAAWAAALPLLSADTGTVSVTAAATQPTVTATASPPVVFVEMAAAAAAAARTHTHGACIFPGQDNTIEPITAYEAELMSTIHSIRRAAGAGIRRPREEDPQAAIDEERELRMPARRINLAQRQRQRALMPLPLAQPRPIAVGALLQMDAAATTAAAASASASASTSVPAAVAAPVNNLNLLRTTLMAGSAAAVLVPVGGAAPALSHAALHGFTYYVESGAPHRVVRVLGPLNAALAVGTNPSNEATWFCDATSTPTPLGPGGLVPFDSAFVQRQRTAWQTGHIIAASLGGSNADPLNFFTQSVQSNNQGGRRGRAERMAAFLQDICPGLAVEIDTSFAYTNLPAVAALTLTPGANDLIPTGGSFSISVQLLAAPVAPAAPLLAGCGGRLSGATFCNSAPGNPCQPAGAATAGSVPAGFQWIHIRRFWRRVAPCAARADGTTWCTWTTPWSNDHVDVLHHPLRGLDVQFVP